MQPEDEATGRHRIRKRQRGRSRALALEDGDKEADGGYGDGGDGDRAQEETEGAEVHYLCTYTIKTPFLPLLIFRGGNGPFSYFYSKK